MAGYAPNRSRKQEDAIVALLSHRSIEDAAKGGQNRDQNFDALVERSGRLEGLTGRPPRSLPPKHGANVPGV